MLWSPEQIAGWLKHTYPHDESHHVSHETIYRSLFIQARGALKKELLEHLRRTRGMRRSRHYTQKTAIHGQIVDAVSISERPASVEDRAVPGHWEGDLSSAVAVARSRPLVERQTRYVMLVKLERQRHAERSSIALIKNARKLPQELYKSLTWDRGTRDARHKRFTMATESRSTSAIHEAPGSAGATRTRTAVAQAVHAQGNRHLGYSQLTAQRNRETIEREAAQDARLPDAR